MIPWEKEVYLSFLKQYIEEENLKANRMAEERSQVTTGSPVTGGQTAQAQSEITAALLTRNSLLINEPLKICCKSEWADECPLRIVTIY